MDKEQTCESMGTHHDYTTSEVEVNAYNIEELDRISEVSGESYYQAVCKKNKGVVLYCKRCGKTKDINLR